MGYLYSELIDRAKISEIIGTNYLNEAFVYQSNLLKFEGSVVQGTTEEWIREELYEGSQMQPIGVNSEINLQGSTQTLYKVPIGWYAQGALLDDIYDDISVKEATRMAETNIINRTKKAAAQGYDDFFVSVLNGYNSYCATNSMNYLDKNGSQISPKILQQGKATLGDQGMKVSILVCRSYMYFQLGALGMAAYTANTLGQKAQDSLIQSGRVVNDTYLGMTILMTDKLKNQGGTTTETDENDHYIMLAQPGSLRGKNPNSLDIRPVIEKERSFQQVSKFKIKVGGGVKSMTWQGSASDDGSLDISTLETSTNWSTAVKSGNEKYIPIAVIRVDYPSFS